MSIYLDNAASTPMDPQVKQAMSESFDAFGNASSTHHIGQQAAVYMDKARDQVAQLLVCDFSEIVFTSGATESNNLIVQGVVSSFKQKHPETKGHIIVSAIEHPSVLEIAKYLEAQVDVTYIQPNEQGVIQVEEVEKEIRENTFFISIMYVNNEVGTIQPIRDIGKRIEKINEDRELPILFHTDATQATNYLNMDVRHLHVHALSFSGHKIYGPKGIGVLYLSNEYTINQQLFGGNQEWGSRPGTSNTYALAGLGKAIELLKEQQHTQEIQTIQELRNTLEDKLKADIPDLIINGDSTQRSPAHLHLTLPGIDAESLYLSLDMKGLAVSLGAACAAGKVSDSYVLQAMGIKKSLRTSSLRISLGRFTTKQEIQEAHLIIVESYQQLKK